MRYRAPVERRLGKANAEKGLAVYYIPGMGHGGPEYTNLIGAQLDALEQWMDYRESREKSGAPAPESLGGYPRRLSRAGGPVARSARRVTSLAAAALIPWRGVDHGLAEGI